NIENEQRFRRLLAEFYLVILLISVVAVALLARSVTNPLSKLAYLVRKIEQGNYGATVRIQARDELGQLADSVNSMAIGLAEKEKVRDLLGKVVSKQIAEELIRNPVELGGEERVVTMMFVDIKGFTTFCEGRAPQEVITVLNSYLSRITNIVEDNQGVVDKFNGDAVMALFGAPVSHVDDTSHAMAAALEIRKGVLQLAAESLPGVPVMEACIGVHTGLVVAGNLGSISRLNYSVIGDAVNLASRLESLTRFYSVSCIVSEATSRAAPGFIYQELDLVRVVGKKEPIRIYELIGKQGEVDDRTMLDLNEFSIFLDHYRRREWGEAEQLLQGFAGNPRLSGLYRLYQDRIANFKISPPAADWRGVYTFDKK
ncbi:MAG: adenylate/guanylate cyclase domain-containing protein, partial [Pseudohongiellaceae bacterium]